MLQRMLAKNGHQQLVFQSNVTFLAYCIEIIQGIRRCANISPGTNLFTIAGEFLDQLCASVAVSGKSV